MDIDMDMPVKTASLVITPQMLSLIAEIDEFKGAWRALGTLAPDRLSALRRVATIESVALVMDWPFDANGRKIEPCLRPSLDPTAVEGAGVAILPHGCHSYDHVRQKKRHLPALSVAPQRASTHANQGNHK